MAVPAHQHPLYTAEEFAAMQQDDMRMELIEGRIITSPPAFAQHGHVAANLVAIVGSYIHQHHLGDAYVATGFITARAPDTVLAPDIAYIQASRVPEQAIPFWGRVMPDMVVEVVMAGDRIDEIGQKVARWLAAGVRVVWVAWPQARLMQVYQPSTTMQELDDTMMLTGGSVLPGFTTPVSEIFG